MSETDPTGRNEHDAGAKLDHEKPWPWLLKDFGKALSQFSPSVTGRTQICIHEPQLSFSHLGLEGAKLLVQQTFTRLYLELGHDPKQIVLGEVNEGELLLEIAKICTAGAMKYSIRGWKEVPFAVFRYYNAMWRHILWGHGRDKDELLHAACAAWNALAVYQLLLEIGRENELAQVLEEQAQEFWEELQKT